MKRQTKSSNTRKDDSGEESEDQDENSEEEEEEEEEENEEEEGEETDVEQEKKDEDDEDDEENEEEEEEEIKPLRPKRNGMRRNVATRNSGKGKLIICFGRLTNMPVICFHRVRESTEYTVLTCIGVYEQN